MPDKITHKELKLRRVNSPGLLRKMLLAVAGVITTIIASRYLDRQSQPELSDANFHPSSASDARSVLSYTEPVNVAITPASKISRKSGGVMSGNLDFNAFKPAGNEFGFGSNDFFVAEIDHVFYVAKKLKHDAAYRAEEISRRLHEVVGVPTVPGRIIIHPLTKEAYYVMPDMRRHRPSFNPGVFDEEIAKTEGLGADFYDRNPHVVATLQKSLFVDLLIFGYDHVFKNVFWHIKEDGTVEMVESDFGAALGVKATGGIAPLLGEIRPIEIYLILTQVFTQTCVNEGFNRIFDYEILKSMQECVDDSDAQFAILVKSVKDVQLLGELFDAFEAQMTESVIASSIAEGFAQLPENQLKTFQDIITEREQKLEEEIARRNKGYEEANAFITGIESGTNLRPLDETAAVEWDKKLNRYKEWQRTYFSSNQLSVLARESLKEMRHYTSEQEYLTKTLQKRCESVLGLMAKLIEAVREKQAKNDSKRLS